MTQCTQRAVFDRQAPGAAKSRKCWWSRAFAPDQRSSDRDVIVGRQVEVDKFGRESKTTLKSLTLKGHREKSRASRSRFRTSRPVTIDRSPLSSRQIS